jgi:AcrR family transcriptional regulator
MAANGSASALTLTSRRPGPPVRRRGSKLEAALLQAAWDELTEVGYTAFTMEGVAVRAKTSRAVLYRRWPNRPELVVAALQHHIGSDPFQPPDTGSLRDDLLAVLRHLTTQVGDLAGVLSFLIADSFNEFGMSPAVLREQALAGTAKGGTALVIERAIARGEIDPARLSPRVRTLPVDLVRHELIMTQAPVPDATVVEIVDRIFLPLVRG